MPTLMELAKEGVLFSNAYSASPLCQPARISIITGLPIWKTGICGNQSPPISDDQGNDTFMNHLQREGYHTGLIGKHHYIDSYGLCIDTRENDNEIKKYGFDYVFQVNDDGENTHNDDEYTAYLKEKGLLEKFRSTFNENTKKGTHPFCLDDTAEGFIGNNALKFIEDYDKKTPFYLNVGFIGPHPPFWHPGEKDCEVDDMIPPVNAPYTKVVKDVRKRYMQKCKIIDLIIGQIIKMLKRKGIYEDTVIMFTSDHGDCLGDYEVFDKRYPNEGSVGIPMIVRGPGVPKQERFNGNRICKALISQLDIYPTILGLAGISEKEYGKRTGRNMIDIFHRKPWAMRDTVYAELATYSMVRTAQWKLVFDPEQGGVIYLYNMIVDPQEKENLAGKPEYANVINDLLAKLLETRIRQTQFTHEKEENRLMRVRV